VSESIPSDVAGAFSEATDGKICPRFESASKNEYQETPAGGDFTIFIVQKVEKIGALILRISKGLLRPVEGNLYLYLYECLKKMPPD
jgi:hypothetical protein